VLRGSHNDAGTKGNTPRADLYLEGSDQHRGWFHSSLLTGCAIDGRAPYKALLTHGFVVDGRAARCPSRKGNVVAPQKSPTPWAPKSCACGWPPPTTPASCRSPRRSSRVVETYRRLRNTLRFLLANTADFDPATRHAAGGPMAGDRPLRAGPDAQAAGAGRSRLRRYEFHKVVQALQNFCSEDLGAFYLDILKDRLYTTPPSPPPAAPPRARCGTSCRP
jgi:isoleucyl-tRNA synthetase